MVKRRDNSCPNFQHNLHPNDIIDLLVKLLSPPLFYAVNTNVSKAINPSSCACGLFHPSDDKQGVAFRYAVEKINANRDILPRSRLSAQIEQISPQDSFHASKRELGLQVVFDFYVFHVLEFSQLIKLSVQELLVFEEFEWKNKSA
ncbi:hypothetical protein PV326_001144 [Microctonus aethiopoides]|nr:hypothetical protein PV326_001144 [Microctonus aethiopoides]